MTDLKYRVSIKDMPAFERPRERLERLGAEALSTTELLAIIIGTGTRGRSALDLAGELVRTFGNLRALESASVHEFMANRGIARAKAVQLKAAMELGKRAVNQIPDARPRITGPTDVASLLMADMRALRKEYFRTLLLDSRNRVIGVSTVSIGSLDSSIVHPREIFREAIVRTSAAVILAHNHPSGDPEPSEEDIRVSARIARAGAILGIEVLDHVIIGDNTYVSLKERKMFPHSTQHAK